MTRLLPLLLLAACGPWESTVRDAIEDARPCAQDSECVVAGSVCPIGCDIAVNAEHLEEIRVLLDGFEPTCDYRCVVPSAIVCEAGLCTTKYEQP